MLLCMTLLKYHIFAWSWKNCYNDGIDLNLRWFIVCRPPCHLTIAHIVWISWQGHQIVTFKFVENTTVGFKAKCHYLYHNFGQIFIPNILMWTNLKTTSLVGLTLRVTGSWFVQNDWQFAHLIRKEEMLGRCLSYVTEWKSGNCRLGKFDRKTFGPGQLSTGSEKQTEK